MQVLKEGKGELIGWRDPDENRQWILENKPRELKDKQMSIQEAVAKFVRDGDFIASGGFGHVRVSMVTVYEIIRQKKKNLTMAGKTSVHDLDVLVTSGCVNRVEAAYSFGHELRGLSPGSRRKIEGGECKVPAENSNAGFQFRWLAAMLGVPFIPARNLMGTDTFEHSSAKIALDPFSKKPVCLFPAAYPDVAFIHVFRCDVYGNSQIDGILVEDFELARAARRLIITTEEIVPPDEIRRAPWKTVIPYYLVDAVVEAPFGAHPCQMPGKYYFDEEHITEWLDASKTEKGTQAYLEKYVFGVEDFDAYLELAGGVRKLSELAKIEQMRQAPVYPWNEKKKGGK